MCNDYGTSVTIEQIEQRLKDRGLRLAARHSNMAPREDIRPSEPAPILRAHEGSIELTELRWGFPPPPAKPGERKRPPVINFRSDRRTFRAGRCLIPASHFFEFTGAKYPKQKWRFTKADSDWFCIAGLWRETEGGPSFTMLTTRPGPDIEPYHDRQIVILEPEAYAGWLDTGKAYTDELSPLPKHALAAARVER